MHRTAQETNQPRPALSIKGRRDGAGGMQQKGDQLPIRRYHLNQHDLRSSQQPKARWESSIAVPLSNPYQHLLLENIASILSSGHYVSALALVRGALAPFNPPRSAAPNGARPKPQRRLCPCTPKEGPAHADRDTHHSGGKAPLAGDC